jgi:hypothetical protein
MKQSNAIETALQNLGRLGSEVGGLREQLRDSCSRLAALEDKADLTDKAAIGEIIGLQAVVALLPRRIASREAALGQAITEVLAASHEEIEVHLGPRGREFEAAARRKVSAALAPHFPNAPELQRAVETSALVRKVLGVRTAIRILTPGEPEEVVAYAKELLVAGQRLESLAKEVS